MSMSIYDLTAYEVIRDKELSDLKSRGVLLKHQKSGARVLLMENDDENKVFAIAAFGQYRCAAYYGALCTLRVKRIPCKRSVCGTCERFSQHILKCDDLSG